MDYDLLLFWLVSVSSLAGLLATWRRARLAARGWLAIYLAVLLLSVAGWFAGRLALLHAAAAAWSVLVFLPSLLMRLYNRRVMRQEYASARRVARIIAWLHPLDGWPALPKLVYALELTQRGDLTAARDILDGYRDVQSLVGVGAIIQLYRLTNQWEELLAWHAEHRQQLDHHAEILPVVLRARGETGDVRGLVELYDRHQGQIRRLVPTEYRDTCRLMLFAFCGRRQAVETLCAGRLAVLPAPVRAFWLATAELTSGDSESARRQLEELLPVADPLLRPAVERRLARISIPPEPLDASAERVIADAATEHGHEERFGVRPSLFSRRARATQVLMAANVVVFAAEICLGGSTDLDVLYRLGALFPPAVRAGEWWRLATATFLHFGPAHLVLNMLALWFLGPFVELALGFLRFVLVYLLAGIGSMGMVTALSLAAGSGSLTVGASGCVMGLVGATGALMLRGWLREKALAAKRRLAAMLLIVAMQFLFDSMVPESSMTGHLSGALIGFAAMMVLPDRLRDRARAELHEENAPSG